MSATDDDNVLAVRKLSVEFPKPDGTWATVVNNLNLTVKRGEVLGIVGESGSGKTMVGYSVLDLVPRPGVRQAASIRLCGRDVQNATISQMQAIRGREVAMVFQDPMSSFNPVRTVGATLSETLRRHRSCSVTESRSRCIEALADVGVPAPQERVEAYPHELSGGLRQRVMIALALLNSPSLLIADEPTTALDATIQAQILDLLRSRVAGRGIVMVTHDLGVAAEICDRILVMRQGQCVEQGTCREVLAQPQHEYTKALIEAVPSFSRPYRALAGHESGPSRDPRPLLEGRNLRVTFKSRGRDLHAVNGVDIALHRGETVGLVGESGSGKSTLISALMRILKPTAGTVAFDGQDITSIASQALRPLRRRLQLVFQDPYASLNPRWSVNRIVAEPLRAQREGSTKDREARVRETLSLVGLPEDAAQRKPAQFSGGQRQRIAIARALVLRPDILIADEPVAALDVSMQGQIVSLLKSLQVQLGIGYLIVAHDLALMHHIADRIVVMYLGAVVEQAPSEQLTGQPLHPYTAALLSAAPSPHPGQEQTRIKLGGEPPSPLRPPAGCAFHERCPVARQVCADLKPALERREDGRLVACHFPGSLDFQSARE